MIKLDINKPIEYPIINLSKSENKLSKGEKEIKIDRIIEIYCGIILWLMYNPK